MDDRPRRRDRFLILWLASVASMVLVLPYVVTLQRSVLEALPIPLPLALAASVAQSAVLLAAAAFLGLRAADAVGLRTPLTDALARRRGVREAFTGLGPLSCLAIGAVTAVAIVAVDQILFAPLTQEFRASVAEVMPTRLEGLLASFYGGIAEEILTRLFLVSVIAWLLRGRMWLAIIGAALIFAAGHLPAVAVIAPLTPAMLTRTLVLNAGAGIAFGWLYWRRGLEAAMVAHFAADIVLHVIVGG